MFKYFYFSLDTLTLVKKTLKSIVNFMIISNQLQGPKKSQLNQRKIKTMALIIYPSISKNESDG